ncbi:MlaA family lipoprotein [Thioalkalivibrio sp. HK1]|uniref:MlaA family lipoprotein n=1 Tax=Thioalkalivibrio sp. HK1 TaxID=1469245 RepID=UPI0012DD0D83|nr:VacJ family lipoprotein [Thioalkalivibrio sp. HK1]
MSRCKMRFSIPTFAAVRKIIVDWNHRRLRGPMVSIAILALGGCASVSIESGNPDDAWPSDPVEPVNRFVFSVNELVDDLALGPVSDAYRQLPEGVQRGIHNVFDNAAYPDTVVNQFLQGKVDLGVKDTARFVVNSTAGIGGVFDVATGMGLERHQEDFGQTLAVWGVGPGSFITLPGFGPSTVRDSSGLAMGAWLDVSTYVGGFPYTLLLKVIDQRSNNADAIRLRDEIALDRYSYTKDAYLQWRDYLIRDQGP